MPRCLIVSGDAPVRDAIKVGLAQVRDMVVETAADAWAIELVRAGSYDLVVADAQLADGTDGVEFLRDVQAASPATLLALATSAKPQARVLARDRTEVDVCAFFRVPITTAEFYRTLARVVERLGAAIVA